MADLKYIFGDEIRVTVQSRQPVSQWAGFPGASGVLGMSMGTRGRRITISGRLRSEKSSKYDNARSDLQDRIDWIESHLGYSLNCSYAGDTYEEVVFLRLTILVNGEGKSIHWNGKECFCNFVCDGLQLI